MQSHVVVLALDANTRLHLLTSTSGSLVYSFWNGTSWVTRTVDSNIAYSRPALALDSSGQPNIAYLSAYGGLTYARWGDSSWITQTVEGYPNVNFITLAVDTDSRPHIAYYLGADQGLGLRYAHWNGTTWITQTLTSSGYIYDLSLALDKNNNPHIGYSGQNGVVYAHMSSQGWISETLQLPNDEVELKLDSKGYPHFVVGGDNTRYLKYAYWNGASWSNESLDDDQHRKNNLSFALTSDDLPRITYHDSNDNALKYLSRAPNPTPTPTATTTAMSTASSTPTLTSTDTATPTFTVTPCATKPAKPTLLKPKDKAKVGKRQVALDWNDVACADYYKVVVKDVATGKKADSKTVSASAYKTKALTTGKTYKWQVKACNALGCSSAARTFTIKVGATFEWEREDWLVWNMVQTLFTRE